MTRQRSFVASPKPRHPSTQSGSSGHRAPTCKRGHRGVHATIDVTGFASCCIVVKHREHTCNPGHMGLHYALSYRGTEGSVSSIAASTQNVGASSCCQWVGTNDHSRRSGSSFFCTKYCFADQAASFFRIGNRTRRRTTGLDTAKKGCSGTLSNSTWARASNTKAPVTPIDDLGPGSRRTEDSGCYGSAGHKLQELPPVSCHRRTLLFD